MNVSKLLSLTLALALVSSTALAAGTGSGRGGKPGVEDPKREEERKRQDAPGMNRPSGQTGVDATRAAQVDPFVGRLTGQARQDAAAKISSFIEAAGKMEGSKAEAFLASFAAAKAGKGKDALASLVLETANRGETTFEVRDSEEVNGSYDISGWFYQVSGMLEKGEATASLLATLEKTTANLKAGQSFGEALRNAITFGKDAKEWEKFLKACPFKI